MYIRVTAKNHARIKQIEELLELTKVGAINFLINRGWDAMTTRGEIRKTED